MKTTLNMAVVAVFTMFLWGCTQTTAPAFSHSSTLIEHASATEVFDAAQAVLKDEFPRIHADNNAKTITTTPVEFVTTRNSRTLRDVYRGKSKMRRTATLSAIQQENGTRVSIRVDIERRDDERFVSRRPASRHLSDSPAYTPIELDGATTQSQNELWTHVDRDRQLERILLDELSALFRNTSSPQNTQMTPIGDKEQN